MDTVTPAAMLSLVVFTLVNLVRYLRGALTGQGGWNGVVTILAAWLIGLVAAGIVGASDMGAGLVIPGFSMALGDMGFFDLVLAGLVIASGANAFNELRGAIDGGASTAKPTLVPEHAPPAPGDPDAN